MSRYAYPEGCFHIEPTPSQPQIAHCHGFFIVHDQRGKGLAHGLKRKQMAALRDLGYDYATCTVAVDNMAQKRVLIKAGWYQSDKFNNSKTGSVTEFWGCPIYKDES